MNTKQSLLAELSQIGESLDKDEYELCSVRTPHLTAVTWERLAEETIKDQTLAEIKNVVENGDQEDILELMGKFPKYKSVLDRLSSVYGVLMYKNRASKMKF